MKPPLTTLVSIVCLLTEMIRFNMRKKWHLQFVVEPLVVKQTQTDFPVSSSQTSSEAGLYGVSAEENG